MQPSPKKPPNYAALLELLGSAAAIIDVRAPLEFAQGRLPNSINLPILNDAERHEVGKVYKTQGNEAATQLGLTLVSGACKAQRLESWQVYANQHETCYLMCWRGGQRSKLAQAWLADAGDNVGRIEGGYKSMRHACIHYLDEAAATNAKPWWVVAGRTGTQKTVLIHGLANSIDLEKMAHHRGSAFGAYHTPQPSLASFENALAVAHLGHRYNTLVLEDESRTIGSVALPESWHTRMQEAPLALVEATVETRVEHIVREYVDDALQHSSPAQLQQHYRGALKKISRRLGGALHSKIDTLLTDAFLNRNSHADWVRTLLTDYYDPMYDYQLARKQARISFRGSKEEVTEFLRQQETVSQ